MKWSEVEVWLDWLSHLAGNESLIEGVINRLHRDKEFQGVLGDEIPICRHCLLEIIILFTTDNNSENRLKQVLKEYDFDGAIIC